MQNQEHVEEKKLSKQEYNRLYYQKNRAKWAAKKKSWATSNVFQIFTKKAIQFQRPSVMPVRHWLTFLKWIEILVLAVLITTITTFLIQEAAAFYLDAQEGQVPAYLKAGIVEGIAILFSFTQSKSSLLRWGQKLVVILLCAFTLWVMSGKLVKTAVNDTSRVHITRQTLKQLESELIQKEQLRNQYLNKGWLGMTRRYEKGLDQLRRQIHATRQELATLQAPQIVLNSVSILIAFRLILVIANLICVHRIVEHFSELGRKEVQTTVEC